MNRASIGITSRYISKREGINFHPNFASMFKAIALFYAIAIE